jgi:hypothetical protein
MFKRATRELAKQSIGADDFDPEAVEEVLAGVSSDESDNDSDSDSDLETTPSIKPTITKKRKFTTEEDYETSDEESENESNQVDSADDEQAEGSEDEEDDETELVFNCDVCPEKRLTTEKQVEEHLKSKVSLH